MKRILCILLALLMLVPMVVSCKKDAEEADESSEDTVSTETVNPYDVYDNLGDLKFGTAEDPVEFSVLNWEPYIADWCIDYSMVDKSIVGAELYERQVYMEERFGIVFVFSEVKGGYNSIPEVNQKVEASIMSGSKSYDLVGHYSVGASLLVTNGYAYNLLEVDHLDLSRSYWPADLLEINVVNNQLYFLSGYLAPTYFQNIVGVFYNQKTIDDYSFENPVVVEEIKADCGIDIGLTLIGMHLKKVAVPLRLSTNKIGNALFTCARTRPKFIGGCRAVYDESKL